MDDRIGVRFGPFRFEPGNGLWRDEVEVALPPRALGLLTALVEQPGVVVSKRELMDAVWRDAFVTEASLNEAIRVLRDALGDDRARPAYIQTVHRRGYRFVGAITIVTTTVDSSSGAHAREAGVGSAEETDTAFTLGAEWRPLIVAGVAGVTACIGIAVVFALFGQRVPDPRPVTRFTIALPEEMALDPLRGSVAVSNDGTRMVYVALDSGLPRLYLRTVDRDTPQVIPGSDGASDPFFSPDGGWVGFFAHGSLKKVPVDGGAPVVLAAARAGAGASWGMDGTIVFGGGPRGGLARVSQDGGDPVAIATPRPGSRDVSYGWPDVLPGGSHVIYTSVSPAGHRVALWDLASGHGRTLIESAAFGRYSPTGHLVFERRGRLEAAPFSLRDLRVTATPRPIVRDLATGDGALAAPGFAFSRTGSLIYVPGTAPPADERLHWLDGEGLLEPVPLPPVAVGSVDLSPDARQLALAVPTEEGADLWLGDLRRGALSRVIAEGPSVSPAWRPNGLEIAFAYSKAGPFNLYMRPAGSDGAPEQLLASPWNQLPTSWSPDGRRLIFTEFNPITGADLWVLDVDSRERQQLVRTLFDETHARFSPDGRWVAYMSNESGRWDVFVRPASGGGPRVQVSTSGGAWPCWSLDGRTLYFNVAGRAAAATVTTEPSLAVSAPLIISGSDGVRLAGADAVAGRLIVRHGSAPSRRELRVVLEWFTELTRLARLPA